MEPLIPLLLLAYVAFGAWGTRRVWRAMRTFSRHWPRRAATSLMLALFFAPSLIPAGHGVAVGPAWMGAAAWAGGGAREVLTFVVAPIAGAAFGLFALWSLGTALRPAAQPPLASAPRVSHGEVVIAVLCALSVPLLAAVGWAAQRVVARQQEEMALAQMLEEQRAENERRAVGTWRQEQRGQGVRWTLHLPAAPAPGTTLARVPASGYVTIVGGPGAVPPGTLVSVSKPGGARGATVTADRGGGFELELEASQGEYLSLQMIRIAMAPGGSQVRATAVTPADP